MIEAWSRLMSKEHANRLAVGFYAVLTTIVFVFLGMQLVVK